MRKKTLLWVIILMSISLIGVVAFQAYWIQRAVQMEEEVFDRNVNDALHQVVKRLETQEAVHFLKEEAPQIRKAALSVDNPSVAEQSLPSKAPKIVLARGKSAKTQKIQKEETSPSQQAPAPTVASPAKVTLAPAENFYHIKDNEAVALLKEAKVNSQLREMPAVTYLKGARADQRTRHGESVALKEAIEIFGKGSTDSLIVWKVMASQSQPLDSLTRKANARFFQRALRPDSNVVLRALPDSFSRAKLEAVRLVQPKDVQAIKVHGKVIDIYTDTLNHRPMRQTYTIVSDSGNRVIRYFPATKGTSSLTTVANFTNRGQAAATPATPALKAEASQKQPERKIAPEKERLQKAQAKAQHLTDVMQKMAVEYVRKEKPLAERLEVLRLEDLLYNELRTRNISTPYQCTLKTNEGLKGVNIYLASSTSGLLPITLRENEYSIRLFPNDVLTPPSFLLLKFPNRHQYVWQSLLLPSAISVLFTLIILLTFSFTLYTILRQKKISEIKNDFINNMTHEFKTPIATISLALDSLVNPKVRSDEVRVNYYARIIRDENKRMHQQVEKVLQTAQMERKTLQLAFEQVDVHQMIKKAAEPFQLHIEQRQGVLDLKLDAQEPLVWADSGHLANMIANLLDNANKYSPNTPRIVIQTATIAKGIHISVEDQGVGMSKEAQKKVFDKFYRIPTGNVHNVKGFGLGLSYVKTMAEAHSGSVHLRSELGKGSKFTLWLPFQKHVH